MTFTTYSAALQECIAQASMGRYFKIIEDAPDKFRLVKDED